VTLTLDLVEEASRGKVLVRVDGLGDGFVTFQDPDPSAAAAALAVTPAGRFVGCAGFSVAAFRLRTPARLARKAWLRVSTERTVKLTLTAEDGSSLSSGETVVAPGASAVASWTREPSR